MPVRLSLQLLLQKLDGRYVEILSHEIMIPDNIKYQILLPFPYAPSQVKGYLLDKTKCKAFIYASLSPSIQNILDERPHIRGIVAPTLLDWIKDEPAVPYGFKKSWDEAADDPWIIFHTSGTTGC